MDAPETEPTHDALDPRIRRSRRMLQDALATLLATKDFDKISIQDIAEASTLNRATFYDHYPDKFALLQCMVGSRFSELMALHNIHMYDCASGLRAIALGLCDYLAEAPANEGKSHEGNMQTAIVGVIQKMLLEGFHDRVFSQGVPHEVVTSTLAWAMYGAAKAWVQSPKRCSAEHMASIIDRLIKPMLMAATEPGHTWKPGKTEGWT
jgi:AcrR family transcriptional regulator